VYVDDVATAFLLADGEVGDRRRYNIGIGTQTSDRELHTLIAATVGALDQPRPTARLGDLRASAIDASRAHHELGWQPAYDLTAGIQSTGDHFRRIPMSQGSQST
jgi:UDP-glucose 4-epimerase